MDTPTYELRRFLLSRKMEYTLWGNEFKDYGVTVVQELLLKGANLEHLEKKQKFYCIPHSFWDKELINLFLNHGCNINGTDAELNSALHLAIKKLSYRGNGWYEIVAYLLNNEIDPNLINLQGETSLFMLISQQCYKNPNKHSLNIVKYMIKCGAKIDIQSSICG